VPDDAPDAVLEGLTLALDHEWISGGVAVTIAKSASALKIEHKDPQLLVTLQTSLFRVPQFQRAYVWAEQQIEDFSSDLWAAFDARKTWFIGTIIVAKGDKIGRLGPALDLIDGQQRLTSLFMWLAALRDECRGRGIDDWSTFIDTSYLRDSSPMAPTGGQPRLTIGNGEVDRYFQALAIEGAPTRAPVYGSEERIQAAFEVFRASVARRLDGLDVDGQTALVADLLEWLKDYLHAFLAVAPDLGSASRVFDLMNSRGRPLTASDLLKSYLFDVTNGAATAEWTVIAQLFDPRVKDAKALPDLDAFVRHQWFSRHPIDKKTRGAPSRRATQDEIRAVAHDKATALAYLGTLREDAEVYLELARPSQQYWEAKSGKGVFEALQDLNRVKVEVFRPLILAVLRRFPQEEQLLFLRSLLSWAFRKKVVTGKLGSGEDEAAYFVAAHSVHSAQAKSTQAVLGLLDIPDDTRFKQEFATLNIEDRQARWVLGRLEDVIAGSAERTTRWDQMTLEHVLPKRAERLADWPGFTAEQHRSYRQNIGNLTLLRKRPNEKAGSGPFLSKVPAYSSSALTITSRLAKSKAWTPKNVDRRAAELAEHAVAAWPLIAPPQA
jgi:hypothetical protein